MNPNAVRWGVRGGLLLASFAIASKFFEFFISRNTFLCQAVASDCSNLINATSEVWTRTHPITSMVFYNILRYFDPIGSSYDIYEPGIGQEYNLWLFGLTYDALSITETLGYGIILGIGLFYLKRFIELRHFR